VLAKKTGTTASVKEAERTGRLLSKETADDASDKLVGAKIII
jgi:hypothetical protein